MQKVYSLYTACKFVPHVGPKLSNLIDVYMKAFDTRCNFVALDKFACNFKCIGVICNKAALKPHTFR